MKISKKDTGAHKWAEPPGASREPSRGRAWQGKLNPAGDVLSHGKLQLQSCRSPSCPLQLPTTLGRQGGGGGGGNLSRFRPVPIISSAGHHPGTVGFSKGWMQPCGPLRVLQGTWQQEVFDFPLQEFY